MTQIPFKHNKRSRGAMEAQQPPKLKVEGSTPSGSAKRTFKQKKIRLSDVFKKYN